MFWSSPRILAGSAEAPSPSLASSHSSPVNGSDFLTAPRCVYNAVLVSKFVSPAATLWFFKNHHNLRRVLSDRPTSGAQAPTRARKLHSQNGTGGAKKNIERTAANPPVWSQAPANCVHRSTGTGRAQLRRRKSHLPQDHNSISPEPTKQPQRPRLGQRVECKRRSD